MFTPRLDILPTPQRALWDELSSTPSVFTLYGGTAVALRLGHRHSVDFDFFSQLPFQTDSLIETIPYLRGASIRQSAANTLTVGIYRQGPVKISYFGGLSLGQILPHEPVQGPQFAVASLLDLSGTKVAVVTQRAELKDYLDIHALLTIAKIPLPEMLAAAKIIYGETFNPLISVKAISYFEDEALAELPLSMRNDLIAAVKTIDAKSLPRLLAIRERQ
jgi:Nucleotidyl transferase AbiEii toxin, Type IV TA system